jgi:hypothetical protein
VSLFFIGYVFTDGCHQWVMSQLNQAYKELPPEDARESPWAWRWTAWAYFKGNVCGDYKVGCSMYKDFCGVPKDYNVRAYGVVLAPGFKKFTGKCTPDGKLGWGPMHPDAPDVYYEYLCLMEPYESGATTANEAKVYFVLFYNWWIKNSPDHKPHPKFNKYWAKVRQKILNGHVPMTDMPNYDYNAKKAPVWKEEA